MATDLSALRYATSTSPNEAAPALAYREGDGEWVAALRASIDRHMREYEQRRSLREMLFPLSRGHALTWTGVLQAEVLWAALLLLVGFIAFAFARVGFGPTVHYLLGLAVCTSPVLMVWTLVGRCYVRRQGRR
jgi:hypothetical protein